MLFSPYFVLYIEILNFAILLLGMLSPLHLSLVDSHPELA